jgi:TRAP-type C4-dicarboxylate transport system substrate-binding protein
MKLCFEKKGRYLKITFLLLALLSGRLYAQSKITIRLASLVPENTPWGTAINKMAAEWNRVTNGEVEVRVYHGATAGDENEVKMKLDSNQIQAAVFTSIGLSSVMPEVMVVSYPFLIRNNTELDEVMRRIKPELDDKIQKNGYTTLVWTRSGWVKFFSKTPVRVPDDLRKIKIGTGADDDKMIQAFKLLKYQVVPVIIGGLLTDLKSGKIDVLYQSPVFAAGYQVFGVAKYMTDINLAPFFGGILMNQTTWKKIPDKYKPQLLAICKQLEKEIESSIVNLESEAVSTMERYGLNVIKLNTTQAQEWYSDTEKYENYLIGGAKPVFNREYYQKITAILTEFRKR